MWFSRMIESELFLISFVFYGCSPLSQPLILSDAETGIPIATTPSSLPLFEREKKGLFLLKDVDSQNYYITNLTGTSMIPLDMPADIRGLDMSPNGQTIAYIPNENPTLYLLDTKSKIVNILVDSLEFQPGIGLAWSPDSQNIVFSCRVQGTSGLSLCLVNVMNKENVQILVESETLSVSDVLDGAISPSWSNDGQKIVFLSSNTSPSSLGGKMVLAKDIWLFDFSTNTAKLIFPNNTEGISHIFTPVFLSENNSILFSGRKDNFNTLFDYEIASQQIQNIMPTYNDFDLVDFILSPDGKSFLVHIPTPENPAQSFVPTLYSVDGHLLEQLNFLANFQVISWSSQQ
jgi:WD40 repeat protein